MSPVALVLEDELAIQHFIRIALEAHEWQVVAATTVARALIEAGTRKPDLVIADLGLPDGDGVEFIQQLRGWSTVPIIVLSARIDESDKIRALDAGADDYLTKPFGVGELLARTRANLRRARGSGLGGTDTFRLGSIEINRSSRDVKRHGEAVHLTPIEYRLLGVLIANAGRVLTHPFLLAQVWGPGYVDRSHYLRVHMANLRAKLEDDPAQPKHLVTETGVGYRLVVE